jgi:CubicO group peptidase (beta-lactamase class C family)
LQISREQLKEKHAEPACVAKNMGKKDKIQALLMKGVRNGVYPGAVLLVARSGEILFFQEVGHRSMIPHDFPMKKDTIFDLASLTKPLATTLAAMKLVNEGKLYLDQPLKDLMPGDFPKDKHALTVRQLLCHCAGFAEWKPLYLELEDSRPEERKATLRKLLSNMSLDYSPGERTLYSDLGFMVLEWVIEKRAGIPMHIFLDRHFYTPLSLKKTFLSSKSSKVRFKEDQFASTEDCPWRGKIMRGSVHDENAYIVGGYSGHAGLFGTAKEVYTLVDLLRKVFRSESHDYLRPETVKTFFAGQNIVDGSTWALGWDTPSPQDSSSGKYFSGKSVGHLGFTGTSVWMDLERDAVVVFLTNRIHPTRDNEKIKAFRPRLHDLIMEELGII